MRDTWYPSLRIVLSSKRGNVKYEYAYLNPANGGVELYRGMDKYISFYNHERPHQKHDYKTPRELFFDKQNVA